DQGFLPSDRQLVAVNSINWARIMMQIVYYFSAALKLGGPDQTVSFSVPTGNFGDIYAGCLARRMGLPIAQLIVATNENDILHRFISRNEYAVSELTQTYSPSMDILISSNFERYLFELFARNGAELTEFMARLGANPGIENETTLGVSEQQWQQMRACFDSASVDDETTCDIIAEVFASHGIVLDPHTAVGVKAGRLCNQDPAIPMVMLATAHPAKFGDAIAAAGVELPALPRQLQDLFDLEERYTVIANDLQAVTDYLKNHS
ncbi:MAG: threonine synthase, partial [Proteobacteria bacterium]|nr:threonine synthase [Pseudomonadota bacterium]